MDILFTGSTGFLGSHLYNQLMVKNEVHEVVRKKTASNRNNIVCDLTKEVPEIGESNIDAVVHCAGLAHFVPKTKDSKDKFYKDNVSITANLLKGLERHKNKPRYFVFISSVAVYGLHNGIDIDETFPLDAVDPYGLSKIESERLVKAWCETHRVILTIFRLPLIAGDNPPGNLGAMLSAVKKGYYVRVMGRSPKRSVVLASDVANIIERSFEIGGVFNLTDDRDLTFVELERAMKIGYGINKRTILLPLFLVILFAKIGDFVEYVFGMSVPINSNKLEKLTSDLTFKSINASDSLKWRPNKVLAYYHNKT